MNVWLRAVACAAGAPEALAQLRGGGRVLSRHGRVLNLETCGGRLLALHAAAVPPVPFSLVLERGPPGAWPDAGTAAFLREEVLVAGHLRVGLDEMGELPPYHVAAECGGRVLASLPTVGCPRPATTAA